MVFDIFGGGFQMGIGSVTWHRLLISQLEWLIRRELVTSRGTSSRFNSLSMAFYIICYELMI
jgi:hypothetical protein